MSIIPSDLPPSEVEFEVPLELQIGALLRHLGIPARSNFYTSIEADHESNWNTTLEADCKLQIGRKVSVNRRIRFWHRFKTKEMIVSAGHVEATDDDSHIYLYCWNTENLLYLRGIGDTLQQAFGKRVTVKLTKFHGIPSAQNLKTLPINTSVLKLTGIDLVDLLVERIVKRFNGEIKAINTNNGSVESQLKQGERILLEVRLISPQGDPTEIRIQCLVYRSDLTVVVREESEGIREAVLASGKDFFYSIQERF